MANEKRLIDANALLDSETFSVSDSACKECENEYRWAIQEAPTVDAVEVVHGRWIDEYPYARCSECNTEWLNCRTDNEPKLFYYCPNCGAKMDGDGNG